MHSIVPIMKLDNEIVQAFLLYLRNSNVKHYCYEESSFNYKVIKAKVNEADCKRLMITSSAIRKFSDIVVVWLYKAERFDMISEPQYSVVFSDDSVIFRRGTFRKLNDFVCGNVFCAVIYDPKLVDYFKQCKSPDSFRSMLMEDTVYSC